MKKIIKQKIRVVANKSPDIFQDEVNKLIDELAYLKPKVEYDISSDIYKALFQFEETIEVPETAAEEVANQGLYFTCENCPRFEPALNNDGSIRQTAKKGACFLQEYTCRDAPACEWFCKQFLRGEIEVSKGGLK